MKLRKLHHISLLETGRNATALVRIEYNGQISSKSFSYKKHGGKSKAIRAAIQWRDSKGKLLCADWPLRASRSSNRGNKSGVVGVSYHAPSDAWVASWREGPSHNRKQCNAYFSCKKFGTAAAKKLAIDAREKALQKYASNSTLNKKERTARRSQT